MYLGYLVDVPDKKGKITFRQKGNAKYVYYEYDRVYDPERKYTIVKRSILTSSLFDTQPISSQ